MKTEKNEIIRQKLDSETETNRTEQNRTVQCSTVLYSTARTGKEQKKSRNNLYSLLTAAI